MVRRYFIVKIQENSYDTLLTVLNHNGNLDGIHFETREEGLKYISSLERVLPDINMLIVAIDTEEIKDSFSHFHFIKNCSETALFLIIDKLGDQLSKVKRDYIDDYQHKQEKEDLRDKIAEIIEQTTRFGVVRPHLTRREYLARKTSWRPRPYFKPKKIYPSDEYQVWYNKMLAWKEDLSTAEWETAKEDYIEEKKTFEWSFPYRKDLSSDKSIEEIIKRLTVENSN